jgi:carbon storage regulator
MRLFSCKKNECILIGDEITLVVVEVRDDRARLGVELPPEMPMHRKEVWDAIHGQEIPNTSQVNVEEEA